MAFNCLLLLRPSNWTQLIGRVSQMLDSDPSLARSDTSVNIEGFSPIRSNSSLSISNNSLLRSAPSLCDHNASLSRSSPSLSGSCTSLSGSCTSLSGSYTSLSGSCTSLSGSCTSLSGSALQLKTVKRSSTVETTETDIRQDSALLWKGQLSFCRIFSVSSEKENISYIKVIRKNTMNDFEDNASFSSSYETNQDRNSSASE